MNHDEIGEIVSKKLKSKGYEVCFSNMVDPSVGEQPDLLGISIYSETLLGEVKTSRSDFKADFKKPWRKEGCGIGQRRVYITPEGLLKPDEIPYGWELWEVADNKSNSIKIIKGMKVRKYKDENKSCWPITETTYPNMSEDEFNHFSKTNDSRIVLAMMTKVFRRMKKNDIDIDLYSKGNV